MPQATVDYKLEGSYSNEAFLNYIEKYEKCKKCLVIMSKNRLKTILSKKIICFKKHFYYFNYNPIQLLLFD